MASQEVEESEDDRQWLEHHPQTRAVVVVGKLLLVPVVVGVLGTWIEVRFKANQERDAAIYNTVSPVLKDLQNQVTQLSNEVELLRKLVVAPAAPSHAALRPRPRPAQVAPSSLEAMKVFSDGRSARDALVNELRMEKPSPVQQRSLPPTLDDVLKATK